jgi:drug/metabolite transporter (DMT)-like permease
MMRGAIVLITALFSVIFLGRKQYAHHLVALFLIVSGVCLVGYAGITASSEKKDGDDDSGSTTTVFGVVVLIIAQCFTGGQFITEEKLF